MSLFAFPAFPAGQPSWAEGYRAAKPLDDGDAYDFGAADG